MGTVVDVVATVVDVVGTVVKVGETVLDVVVLGEIVVGDGVNVVTVVNVDKVEGVGAGLGIIVHCV